MKYFLLTALVAFTFTAKAQFQSVQFLSSVEYVKFTNTYRQNEAMLGDNKYPLSNRLGVDVQYGLSSKISLHSGFRLSMIRQFRKRWFDCTSGETEISLNTGENATDGYFEIPIGVRYFFKSKAKFQSYIEPFGSYLINFIYDNFSELGFAYGINYNLNKRWDVFAQPTYRHSFKVQYGWGSQTRDNLSLEFGVRLKRR
jgi:hypothetical protein